MLFYEKFKFFIQILFKTSKLYRGQKNMTDIKKRERYKTQKIKSWVFK